MDTNEDGQFSRSLPARPAFLGSQLARRELDAWETGGGVYFSESDHAVAELRARGARIGNAQLAGDVFWASHIVSVDPTGLISESQMRWALESIQAHTRQVLPVVLNAMHAHQQVTLRASSIFIDGTHFAWAAEVKGQLYFGDTLFDTIGSSAWTHMYDLFNVPMNQPMDVIKVSLQKQRRTFCGIYSAVCLFLIAEGVHPTDLATFSFDEEQLLRWFVYSLTAKILLPPAEGVEYFRKQAPCRTRGGRLHIKARPAVRDFCAEALKDDGAEEYLQQLVRRLENRRQCAHVAHFRHHRNLERVPSVDNVFEISHNQVLWGLSCIKGRFAQNMQVLSLSSPGADAERPAEGLKQVDVVPYTQGDGTHYLWIVTHDGTHYVGLHNNKTLNTAAWDAIYDHLGASRVVENMQAVKVCHVPSQRQMNPLGGIFCLAYASLVAQGTPPRHLHRAVFNENRLLQWFCMSYQLSDDDGSGPCLLPLIANIDYKWRSDTQNPVERIVMPVQKGSEREYMDLPGGHTCMCSMCS